MGRFGYRLLVTAVVSNKTTLYAIDCRGRARVIARGVVRVEGGGAVAPRTFGRFGGWLVAVDESGGNIYAFNARGRVRLVARPRAPAGGDIGVESIGFVPRGFGRGGLAYLADFGAPGSPTQGSDSVLSLSGSARSCAHASHRATWSWQPRAAVSRLRSAVEIGACLAGSDELSTSPMPKDTSRSYRVSGTRGTRWSC